MEGTTIRDAAGTGLARVRVGLDARSYDIVAGPQALGALGKMAALWPKLRRCFVVTDATVEQLHGAAARAMLQQAGIAPETVVLPPGEGSKCFAELERLCAHLLRARLERGDVIVALGGGVIGDLAGFAAAILLRGIDYVQVPTTLLAQVDSAVGGKTAIDTPQGKNLVGAFHQPRLVVADTALLDTLPDRERRAGYAEIVKYGLLGDATFFTWLESNGGAVIARSGAERTQAVVTSCRAKAAIVAEDEREAGRRALLNLGHTFAHALEIECGYDDTLRHGEAVALGMVMAFDLSAALGLCPPAAADRVRRHIGAMGLPASLRDPGLAGRAWSAERLMSHMLGDKKVLGGRIRFVLARDIGHAFLADDVPEALAMQVLRTHGAA